MRSGITLDMIADGDTFISDPGSPFVDILSPVARDDGGLDLIVTGRENWQEKINSYRETCDMEFIMSRLMAGDDSVLYAKNPLYGDFTGCTYNNAEMLQNIMSARAAFDNLSPDTRAKFNDSFYDWFASAGSQDWAFAMSGVKPTDPVKPSESVEKKGE